MATDTLKSRRTILKFSAALGGVAMAPALANAQTCPEDTLDRTQRTGVFNLGARESAPPYGFKDASGNWTGFATELALIIHEAVNKELGGKITINYVPVTSQTRIPLLQNATIDM